MSSFHQHLTDCLCQKESCHHHHAVSDGNKAGPGKRVRGIGAQACARHGCFCLSSVVDFVLGEKQMCMDYSLCECFKTTNMDGIKTTLCIYDIMCQYHVNLLRRISDATTLSIPEALIIIKAIGLWHVHGHREECLY